MAAREPVTLGLDLGTSGVRVVAVAADGDVIAEATAGYPMLTPQPGWTEERPADWEQATRQALAEIAEALGDRRPAALGLSGQMHGMTPLASDGTAVRPAILWNDQRTGAAVEAIHRAVPAETLIERCGNPAITGFQLPKIQWLRDNEPEAFARTAKVLLPKDYIGYRLTGQMVTEPADGSGVGAMNIARRTWDDTVLAGLDLPSALFPQIVGSRDIAGYLTAEMAQATGLPEGLPVIAGGGDNACAGIGLGITSDAGARGSVSLGTSGVIFLPLPDANPDPNGRIHLFCHADGGYHLLGVVMAAAGSLQWVRDTLWPEVSFDELMRWAAEAPPGCNGTLFLPHLAGERVTPDMDPDLKGSWLGLSLATSRADMVRAVLEGVAYALGDTFTKMRDLAPAPPVLLGTGGGTQSSLWRQIVADVLATPLALPNRNQGAAYGAGLLARAGVEDRAIATVLADLPAAGESRVDPAPPTIYGRGLAAYRKAPRTHTLLA